MISFGHYLALGHRLGLSDISLPRDVHESVVLVVFLLHLQQKPVDLRRLGLQELWPEAPYYWLSKEPDALTVFGLIEELEIYWPNFVKVRANEFFDFMDQILSPGDPVRVDQHEQGYLVVFRAGDLGW